MNSWMILISFTAGLASGFLFYGGLWMTVKKGMSMKRPQLLFAVSFLLRSVIVIITFYFAGSGQWQRIVICAVGLLIARVIVTYATREKQRTLTPFTKQ
ncbi:ATP synthase subunit I [Agriterribacter sp.]|uniref:ATP synthase subunit I n=1 Tax=Agriterribacter sp. TaxID=2821509 RepID=UPI002C5CA869|nr:ATP synthase subunit I [Agriterribacter sp.]HRP57287.1 ATP synthase subunit I [Agriterribacter sp.]